MMMRLAMIMVVLLATLQVLVPYGWFMVRPVFGWLVITVGLIGCLFPIIPGIPLLIVGSAMVGQRNRVIRWTRVNGRRFFRSWATLRIPLIGTIGRWIWRIQQEISRQYRHLRWWQQEQRQKKQQQRWQKQREKHLKKQQHKIPVPIAVEDSCS